MRERDQKGSDQPTQLTEPKGKDKDGKPAKPVEIPVPKVSTFRAAIRKVAQPIGPSKRPGRKQRGERGQRDG